MWLDVGFAERRTGGDTFVGCGTGVLRGRLGLKWRPRAWERRGVEASESDASDAPGLGCEWEREMYG